MNVGHYAFGVAASLGVACVSHAGIYVEYRSGTATGWLPWFTNTSTSVDVLNLDLDSFIPPLASGTYYIRVWCSSPATEDLPFIYIGNSDPNRSVVLLVGNGANGLNQAAGFAPACRDLTGVRASGAYLTAQISVGRDIRKPDNLPAQYGHSDIDHLVRLDVVGSINSNVYQIGDNVSMGTVVCGNVGANGSLQARGDNSSISLVNVNNGNLAGHIYAVDGDIQRLTVSGNVTGRIQALNGSFGDIRISGALATPNYGSAGTTWPIRVTGGINKLIAGSISANITTQPDTVGNGRIGLLKTTNGPLSGGVALVEFTTPTGTNEGAGIDVNGDLSGNVQFLSSGTRTKDFLIKGSLTGTIRFASLQPDLNTQIIVNAANGTGVWGSNGKVLFGSASSPYIVMSPSDPSDPLYLAPNYNATSAQLGGGSIGVVPFALHDNACSPVNPPNGGASTQIPMDPGSVSLEFYGPIREEIEDHRPFNVQFFSSTRPVEVDATEWFDWTINGRVLTLVRNQCLPFGTYTVTPKLTGSERLLCITGLTTGAPVPVAPFEYLFRVQSNSITCPCYTSYECPLPGGCPADFDSNGGIDGADQAAFFVNYEAGCLCADVDENGGIDAGDLALFMTLYEAGGC